MKTRKMYQRLLLLCATLSASLATMNAQILTKTFTFNFNANDFKVEQITTERKCEIFAGIDYGIGELGEPNLPHTSYEILLPDNYRIKDFMYTIGDDTCQITRVFFYPTFEDFTNETPEILTMDSIPLYPTPQAVAGPGPHPENPEYPLITFPTKVQHFGNNNWDGYRLEIFEICPFTYYAAEQKLVLATSIKLTVSIEPYNNGTPSHSGEQDNQIKKQIFNPEDFGIGVENWQPAPRPFPQWADGGELKFNETMYMLNVGAGKFFCGGNAWNTQTSVGDKGYKVYFEQYLTNGFWDGKTVYFRNYVETKGGQVMDVFFESITGDCYVDCGSHPNFYWKIEKNNGNNYYRLSMAEANPDYQTWQVEKNPGTYFGWDAANGTVASAFLNPTKEGVHVDWAFLSEKQYEEYQNTMETYRVAQKLKALIDEAREKGIGTKEQEDIYANEAATKDELNAAIATVTTAILNWDEQNVDPAKPVNLTSSIVNPNYDDNNNTGWNGTIPGFQNYTNAEHYGKTFDTWQMVENLPNGVYKLTVQGFYRPAEQDATGAVFYAANGTDSVTTPVTNIYEELEENGVAQGTMQYADEQFAKGKYLNNVFFTVTNNKVRIGVALPQLTGHSDWAIWDNWQLTYYGNKGEASYNGIVKEMANANLTRFDTVIAKMTVGTVDTYKACLNSLTATDIAGINKAKQTIEDAISTVEENMDAWEKYLEFVAWSKELVQADYIYWTDDKRALDDYLKEEAEDYVNNGKLTTEELMSQNVQIEQWIREILIVVPCPTYMNWSYVSFDKSSADKKEKYAYTRYSIGDLTSVGRVSYIKLLEYTACDDHSAGDDVKVYRIRFDGRSRIYILKEDAPDYRKQGIILKEEGLDYLLYDFEMEEGEEFCKYTENGKDTVSITISERTTVTCSNGQTFNAQRLSMGTAWWIETWGSTEEFLYPFRPNRMERDCGSSLNYAFLMEGHETPLFYYNPFGDITGVSTAFKADDCAMDEFEWLAIEENTIEDTRAQIRISGSTVSCTAPNAVKLEVYTIDAIKAGEARFVDGEAKVKVNKAPAMYLYIVTYPDGRRESGKVRVSEE